MSPRRRRLRRRETVRGGLFIVVILLALIVAALMTWRSKLPPAGASSEQSALAESPALSGSAPNILLVLLDDAGYGQTGTFGAPIPTPTLDGLARDGLRFTRFNVTALCSPTRAALLTGRNNHAVGMGTITNWSTGDPGYNASIPKSAAMVSEILRQHGYATASFGKWHLIPDPETTPAGPFDHWPTHQGFEYFYGFLGGETDQWHPELVENTLPARMQPPPGRESDYTLTEDLATHARTWLMRQKSVSPDRPVFMYFAPGAVHAPLQAPKKWIEPFAGKFDMGWDEYRKVVFESQKRLRVIPQDTLLTPRPSEIPAWDSLDPERKKVAARLMEVFAGFMSQADHEIGRVIDGFRDVGQIDNTMIIVIAGDNGASLEGGLDGTDNVMELVNGLQSRPGDVLRRLDAIGGPSSNPHYPVGWAWAGNTPFQWGKRFASHLGGTRDPMIISWPGHVASAGSTRPQYTHVIDVFPTILDAANIAPPHAVNGVEQQVVDGVSFLDALGNAGAAEHHTQQYYEMHGNRSMYDRGWIASKRSGILPWTSPVATSPDPAWELYDLTRDFSEAHDLSRENPGKLEQLKKEFDETAARNKVLPINPSFDRAHPNPLPPGGRAFYTFYPGTVQLFDATAPATRNRTHTITAYVDIPPGGANGVIAADGGMSSGYALYMKDGRPAYTYNYLGREVTTMTAPDRLPAGKARVDLLFVYEGGGEGNGATVRLSVNGAKVAEAHLSKTVPKIYTYDESFDIGEDTATAVGPYTAPFPFTGTIERVEIRTEERPQP
jgi:arylsulfatase